MAKILSLDDLIERKNFEESNTSLSNSSDLYDLVIPLGVPQSLIYDLVDMFDLTVEKRNFASENPDLGSVNAIVLRGELEMVKKAESFMKAELSKWLKNLSF